MKLECEICPHHCKLNEGQIGICHGRINKNGKVVSENYGKITAIALDPIEKKPIYHFYPGSRILSVGSYGCNLNCPFCQNCDISMSGGDEYPGDIVSPGELVNKALELQSRNNIGIAYTYNEPLIGYEYVYDCSVLAKQKGLKNIVVTNGYINEEPFRKLLPHIDALNIDLKGFTDAFYRELRGDLETVKRSIEMAAKNCHVEVTTLVIPDKNDSEEEMEALSRWIAGLHPEIPLHISRFFPRWKMQDKESTPIKTIYHLAKVARKHLKHVYEGNC
ncbi:AmmeMemoRadiSam system radical SAM enzyme [Mobilitalea sibirica]|uniref:AmmeMemoRadiSam system radical SAM enzyme n=1 Tax=Mobilitalea sibirica TaxID=1462919 RepID=A0A8J7H9Z3_9FIRM|nr:AmmeMemoRadiSam system radical SAM enzyme [Mobilitalea sibirica]MBH1941911.1 AmmeMemoRadiSam system radical SAM enzyme [Mobilitalea sibirica]